MKVALRKMSFVWLISRLKCDESHWVSFVYPVVVQILTRSLVQLWYIHNLTTGIPVCHHFQKNVLPPKFWFLSLEGGPQIYSIFSTFRHFRFNRKYEQLRRNANVSVLLRMSLSLSFVFLYLSRCIKEKKTSSNSWERRSLAAREVSYESRHNQYTGSCCWWAEAKVILHPS